jgi:hypothetical protein
MATRFVFTPYSAEFPATNFPALQLSNRRPVLAFDASTDEACYWTFVAPQGITGTITVVITYAAASATSGAFRWEALLECITDGDTTDTDATTSFDATNSNGATVPGTAGHIDQISITVSNSDSIAAGDYCRLQINRDANGGTGTDDATGDAYVLAVELRDAA